jgi:hypothetical protein
VRKVKKLKQNIEIKNPIHTFDLRLEEQADMLLEDQQDMRVTEQRGFVPTADETEKSGLGSRV